MKSQPQQSHLELSRFERSTHRWGVILAGGEGKRLLSLTRRIAGDERPKQFCAIVGRETLLDQTRAQSSPAHPARTHGGNLNKGARPFLQQIGERA